MYNLWVIHMKILSGLFVIYVFLGKLQKIRALMMFVEHVYLNLTWSRCLQDSVNDRWQTSVDTKDSAHFLGILTIGITAGKGCEAFYNTDPFLLRSCGEDFIWQDLSCTFSLIQFLNMRSQSVPLHLTHGHDECNTENFCVCVILYKIRTPKFWLPVLQKWIFCFKAR